MKRMNRCIKSICIRLADKLMANMFYTVRHFLMRKNFANYTLAYAYREI